MEADKVEWGIYRKGNVDNNGHVIMLDGLAIPPIIPVIKDFHTEEVLSIANVFMENGVLMAEFEVEDKYLNHYPVIGAKVTEFHLPETKGMVIDKADLFSIGLSSNKNVDTTIPRLSDNTVL